VYRTEAAGGPDANQKEVLVKRLFSPAILIPIAFFATATARLCAQETTPERINVTWSDPSRPGLLKVNLFNVGAVTVKTHNRPDVIIEAKQGEEPRFGPRGNRGERGARGGRGGRGDNAASEAAADGLKRIGGPTAGGLSIEESNNVMNVSSSPFGRCCMDYEILVPAKTNLNLSTMTGSGITVDGVEGEIEVTNMNGPLNLTNVAGSVVASSMNGKVTASLRQVAANKMMSFASMNGDIDVTLPASTKANLQMRTNGGEIYSNFDFQPRPAAKPIPQDSRQQGGNFHVDFDTVTSGVINGGGTEFDLRSFQGNIYIRKGK
jgi:hypothetical protein